MARDNAADLGATPRALLMRGSHRLVRAALGQLLQFEEKPGLRGSRPNALHHEDHLNTQHTLFMDEVKKEILPFPVAGVPRLAHPRLAPFI